MQSIACPSLTQTTDPSMVLFSVPDSSVILPVWPRARHSVLLFATFWWRRARGRGHKS